MKLTICGYTIVSPLFHPWHLLFPLCLELWTWHHLQSGLKQNLWQFCIRKTHHEIYTQSATIITHVERTPRLSTHLPACWMEQWAHCTLEPSFLAYQVSFPSMFRAIEQCCDPAARHRPFICQVYPSRMSLLLRAISLYTDKPEVDIKDILHVGVICKLRSI